MRYLISYVVLSFWIFFGSNALADRWPVAVGLEIVRCNESCTSALYKWGGIEWVDAPSDYVAGNTTQIEVWGVHCSAGDKPGNFTDCGWTQVGHAPNLDGRCVTTRPNNWTLETSSRCPINTSTLNSLHIGAKPGAECAMFGKAPSRWVGNVDNRGSLLTPWGPFDAATVANGGNAYCIKPLAPNTICNISVDGDGVLDHGVVEPNSVTTRSLTATVNCGNTPNVIMLGSVDKINLGPGVSSVITLGRISNNKMDVFSTLKTLNAESGNYSGAFILVVSPQ